MLAKILIAVALITVVFIVIVALQPADFRIARSATLPAAPTVVFEHVNDLHKWQAWSPWARLDPTAKTTFDGPPAGTGASFTWAGNSQVGEGRMTVTESRPHELVRFKLEFFKPFTATNVAEFTFKPEGAQTTVTWSMSGTNNFVGKAMGLIMNCDKMIGGQFEQGFANLREIVQPKPQP